MTRGRRPAERTSLLLLALAVAGCARRAPAPKPDPVSFRYLNASTSVAYVGSRACRPCHADIYAAYMKSEMGRSISVASPSMGEFANQKPVVDSTLHFEYETAVAGGKLYQVEFRRDASGRRTYERRVSADYAVGSGNNLRMFFHDEHGMLYELPLTWYIHKKKWDLSPGYRDFGNLRFARYARPRCIQCHDSVPAVDSTALDRYVTPYPLGIGCERCHGPGALHVREKSGDRVPGLTPLRATIVNPKKLPPAEQLDVCRQCHLQGKAWALNGVSEWFDFRPGQPLSSQRSVFVPASTPQEVFEVADSPHRLSLSRCFKESGGALTCLTCHDPHYSIKTFTAAHYNEACLGCHASLPGERSSHAHARTEDCIGCHMNRTGDENTLHGVSNTDHWIRVRASATAIDWTSLRRPASAQEPVRLVAEVGAGWPDSTTRRASAFLDYYREVDDRPMWLDSAIGAFGRGFAEWGGGTSREHLEYGEALAATGRAAEAVREWRIALMLAPDLPQAEARLGERFYGKGAYDSSAACYRVALRSKPREPSYLQGLGLALAGLGQYGDAVRSLEASLAVDGGNSVAYYDLASIFGLRMGRWKDALRCANALLALDPDFAGGHLTLGNIRAAMHDYAGAAAAYREEIARDSASADAHANLGRAYQLLGRKGDAQREFDRAAALRR